jgi:hypothetical protein
MPCFLLSAVTKCWRSLTNEWTESLGFSMPDQLDAAFFLRRLG